MRFYRKYVARVAATLVIIPALSNAASVYETHDEFLARAFGDTLPDPAVIWLSGDRKTSVRKILGHDYPALRLRYWCEAGSSAWILDEIGKELPITVGVIADRDHIRNLRVLTYRENRGGEVATSSFTDQFNQSRTGGYQGLDTRIDGISGATLSVRALTRLAALALFLHSETGCYDGT